MTKRPAKANGPRHDPRAVTTWVTTGAVALIGASWGTHEWVATGTMAHPALLGPLAWTATMIALVRWIARRRRAA